MRNAVCVCVCLCECIKQRLKHLKQVRTLFTYNAIGYNIEYYFVLG